MTFSAMSDFGPPFSLRGVSASGCLIAVEGLDGGGKTTIVDALALAIERCGFSVVKTRIPSTAFRATQLFRDIHDPAADPPDSLAFEVSYMADRIQHCRSVIDPALRKGAVVISDRYLFSSIGSLLLKRPELASAALQAVCDAAWFSDLCRYLATPHIWLLLSAQADVLVRRLEARNDPNDSGIDPEHYQILQERFRHLATRQGLIEIEASGPVERTLSKCMETIAPFLRGLRARHGN